VYLQIIHPRQIQIWSGELIFHWGAIESPGAGWSNPPPEAQKFPGSKLFRLLNLIASTKMDD